jgi:L-lactate dehydrogenase complex protein LldG
MSGAREQILGRIRNKLGQEKKETSRQAVQDWMAKPGPKPEVNPIPARAQLDGEDLVDMFRTMVLASAATVDDVDNLQDVPAAISSWLAEQNLPAEAVMSPDKRMDDFPWDEQSMLTLRRDRAQVSDAVGITPVFSAVAETGTLMMTSGADNPTTLNFLPDTHVAIVRKSEIVGTYEEAWANIRLRQQQAGDANFMPRTVNLVTGPSRSGDIDKTLFMGAHGPRQLHVVIVDDGEKT